MNQSGRNNLGQVAATVRRRRGGNEASPIELRRQLVADLCKLLGDGRPATSQPEKPASGGDSATSRPAASNRPLPRLRQTLDGLLAGDSEKQIARKLELSPHTVHVYVKSLYRRFRVSSRGELLARWVKR